MLHVYELATRSIGYADDPAYRAEVATLLEQIELYKRQHDEALKRLTQACKGHRAWALLRTIPGVGPQLASVFVAEIGDVSKYESVDQVLRLAGLNLCQAVSGQSKNGAPMISHAGRHELRRALYLAVKGAAGKNSLFKARYRYELSKRGGPGRKGAKQSSYVKLMAKLLRIVFAIMRDGTAFEESLYVSAPT